MRDFGLGKHSIDERIQDEARSLVEIFRQKSNTAFDPQDDITKAISNIICSIAFGKRYRKIAKYSVTGSTTHAEFQQGMVSPNLPANLNGVAFLEQELLIPRENILFILLMLSDFKRE